MNPVYINPSPSPTPLVELKEDQNLYHFNLIPQEASSSSSCPYFFSSTQHVLGNHLLESHQNQQKVDSNISQDGSSDLCATPCSFRDRTADNTRKGPRVLSIYKREVSDHESKSIEDGSIRWMASRVRLMGKMIDSNTSGITYGRRQQVDNREEFVITSSSASNSNDTVRVCADCKTTKTPLWRSGPQGPKSVCNACGIKRRKARQAMAAAAATNGTLINSTSKKKKSRKSYVKQHKDGDKFIGTSPDRYCKKIRLEGSALSLSKKSAFTRVFPQDEEDAALLLMALSCGLVHS